MAKVFCVSGTRPGAIKMAPVIRELSNYPGRLELRFCVTAQHRGMLDQVLKLFDIEADIDLDVMQADQSLSELTTKVLAKMAVVLEKERPDWVFVLGDTTTAMAAALASFYFRIPVGHIEAGLRTDDRCKPFPEEMNRRIVSELATHHFAPTPRAEERLIAEGVDPRKVFLTGNTVIDAIHWILETSPSKESQELFSRLDLSDRLTAKTENFPTKLILVTAHRRESFGPPLESLCRGLRAVAERNQDILIVYPVHLNPKVQGPVYRILSGHPRIRLIDPVPYESFLRLMKATYFILTDSGGIQEEVSVLGKPVLVLREVTERPEIVEAGIAKLIGTSELGILTETEHLLRNQNAYLSMAKRADLFGDGHAAERIVSILLRELQ